MVFDSNIFKGVFIPIVTAFNKHDQLDELLTKHLCDYFSEYPVSGYYVGGSTGECFVQTIEERATYLEMVARNNKDRKTLIAHIGSTALEESFYLGRIAKDFGYDAISAVPPFYYDYSKKEIFNFYEEITKTIDLPFFIYNIPSTTNIDFNITDLEYLLQIDNIVGLKHTTTDFFIVERIKNSFPNCIIYNGPDQMFLAGLSMGCDGGIGSTYNIMPSDFCNIYSEFQKGNYLSSKKYQSKVNNVIRILLEMNFYGAIKYLLKRNGIDCGRTRKPFSDLSPEQTNKLDILFNELI